MDDQKEQTLERLEKLYRNLDTGMTRDKYLDLCEQLNKEPDEREMPPDWEDFPYIVQAALSIFNMLGDRIFPDIGYIGKDYTLLPQILELYEIEDKEFLLELLNILDSRAIKKSSENLKREMDKLKRK